MRKESLGMASSTVILTFAILVLPNQFLFSKTVPNSFWTAYFPLPFGAGWFITFITLIPVFWFNKTLIDAIKRSVLSVVLSLCVAIPVAMFMTSATFSFNNVFNQYLWAGILCFPPLLLHVVFKGIAFNAGAHSKSF